MLKNYFKTALRNLLRQRGYSLINITGLAIGMACCLLILMFVNDELSYDNYSEYADRIHRITLKLKFGGRDLHAAVACAPMAKTLINDYPEVEEAVRFRSRGSYIIKYGENTFKEQRFIFSDPTFFKVFDIPLLKGNPGTALKDPNTLVLSKKTAEKYFGREDPIGKIVKVDNKDDYKITGVFDQIPHNTHFHFDVIASLDSLEESREQMWWSFNFNTYLVLSPQADPKSLEAKFSGFIKKYMAPQLEKLIGQSYDKMIASGNLMMEFSLQPLQQIHLYSDLAAELAPTSDIKYVYIFSAIAFFILVIASINFMNLSTARSAGRAREVGIRKVVGSQRSQLVRQFLSESMLLSIISMILALVLVKLALPSFNNLSGKTLTFSNFYHGEMILAVIVVTLLTGILAGLYPAFFISAFQPIKVLKGQLKSGVKSGWLRSGLVVFQFTASIILIIGTLVVMSQLKYIQNKKLGFNKEQVLILDNAYLLDKQAEIFKNEMLAHSQIKSATISSFLPVPSDRNNSAVFPEGQLTNKNSTSLENWRVDYDYIKTLGMKIIKGRDFSREFSTDKTAVIINQQTAKQFDWKEPLGKHLSRVTSIEGDLTSYTVIGVVEDFHFDSLRNTIGPLLMYLGEANGLMSFRINTRDISGTIALLKDKWNKFLPGQPFEYFFLDERFYEIYKAEQQLGKIFGIFAVLAIFVGCLGLFGLAAFIAERRTKEIGIRKALGASVSNIIRLLSKEFVILVAAANVIAWPAAYLIMNQWLKDFAYRTSLNFITFLAAGAAALIIALLTTSYQAIKAALSDPVQSLKYE
jgi:putative ABC transport system permease protein